VPARLFCCILLFGAGCGGSPRTVQTVTVPPTTSVARADPPPVVERLSLLYERSVSGSGDVRGFALDGDHLLVNVGGTLAAWDGHGPLAGDTSSRGRLVVVGDDAFDLGTQLARAVPKHIGCEDKAFSLDATRMSANCRGAQGEQVVVVFDLGSGAEIGTYKELQTAAPIRAGAITQSGNFIRWVARANGAFEEIKSHVTGPMMSSHESLVFTTVDRQWYTDDKSPPQMLNPHDGRTLFTLMADVDTVFFSPSSKLFAARHSKNWSDLMHGSQTDKTTLTLHRSTSADVVATLPGDDAVEATFSRDDAHVAARHASGAIRVYALR
jgi:hypothetical protein